MTTLQEARAEVAAVIEAQGVKAFTFVPERYVPPMALLKWGSPYLEKGLTFGQVRVRYDVEISVGAGTNESVTAAMDSLLDSLAVAFYQESTMNLETVSEIYGSPINGTTYLTADMTVTYEIQL